MAIASTLGPALAVVLAYALLACGRTPVQLPDEGPTVDPEIYALGFCSLKCWRLDQCGLTDGVPKQTCEQTCIDDALATLRGDPCWAEQIEVRRCLVREAACEGVDDEELLVGSEAVCDDRRWQLDACDS